MYVESGSLIFNFSEYMYNMLYSLEGSQVLKPYTQHDFNQSLYLYMSVNEIFL